MSLVAPWRIACFSKLRLRLFNSPAHQRFPGLKVRPPFWREPALAEFSHRFHQLIKRWLARPGGVVTRSPRVSREGGKDGRSQSIQDEGSGSRVDVLTNGSGRLHLLEKILCRTRIRRPGCEETARPGE